MRLLSLFVEVEHHIVSHYNTPGEIDCIYIVIF